MNLGCGLKFCNGVVFGSCGISVHESITAYLSLSDKCESVNMSSSSISLVGLLKLCLSSSFSGSYR